MKSDYIRCEDFTINGECSCCGQCCSDLLPVSNNEISRIKHYIKRNNIKQQRVNIAAHFDLTCPFRDNANRKCLIYAVRPEICKTFRCDYDKDYLIKNRNRLSTINKTVSMRKVFFDSNESGTALFYIMNGITELN